MEVVISSIFETPNTYRTPCIVSVSHLSNEGISNKASAFSLVKSTGMHMAEQKSPI